ncbi:regucalcin-like [Ostrea edulis]|uniref:regucalcin-like n=1 Tax=Ostrea edulis TaxID=37623 RepID=UPI0024AFB344|nr:regucalcin-like [Ostrea edulis]
MPTHWLVLVTNVIYVNLYQYFRMNVEYILKNAAGLDGEGPHWDDVTGTLLYVDINGYAIHRYDAETGSDDKLELDGPVGFAVPARKGGLIASVGRSLVHVDWDTKKVTKLHEVEQGLQTRFNDGKCDPKGRVWAGTMGPEEPDIESMPKIGNLYCLDLDGSLHTLVRNIGISNGLAWNEDEKTMYYVDSTPRQIYRYSYDAATRQISNKKIIVDNRGDSLAEKGVPDGMTIDTEGKLWVACYLAGKVVQYDPETGKELQTVYIPSSKRITSCCFGGKNLDELYVTCSAYDVPKDELQKYPLSGSICRVSGLGVKGYKANIYEGRIMI